MVALDSKQLGRCFESPQERAALQGHNQTRVSKLYGRRGGPSTEMTKRVNLGESGWRGVFGMSHPTES